MSQKFYLQKINIKEKFNNTKNKLVYKNWLWSYLWVYSAEVNFLAKNKHSSSIWQRSGVIFFDSNFLEQFQDGLEFTFKKMQRDSLAILSIVSFFCLFLFWFTWILFFVFWNMNFYNFVIFLEWLLILFLIFFLCSDLLILDDSSFLLKLSVSCFFSRSWFQNKVFFSYIYSFSLISKASLVCSFFFEQNSNIFFSIQQFLESSFCWNPLTHLKFGNLRKVPLFPKINSDLVRLHLFITQNYMQFIEILLYRISNDCIWFYYLK